MATIRKRNGRYQAQVRVQGCGAASRTFSTKADAQAWARLIESEADRRGLAANRKVLDTTTVGDILNRYMAEVTPKKRGALRETFAIKMLLKHGLAGVALSALTVAKVARHRDLRLRTIKPASINRELAIYRHAFEVARHTWDFPLSENPFALVEKPKVINARTRRLEEGEWARLQASCQKSRNPHVAAMVELGVETAMRRGEVLRMRWGHLDAARRTLHIPTTKNGHPRTIPLTSRALAILLDRKPQGAAGDEVVFPTTDIAVRIAWRRIVGRAKLIDLRYHDLRHEAISRFFELGLSIPEVALISGHRDYKMLARYTHLRAEDIADKLK